jgi:UDP-N-acetylmuramate-alanine ligase
LATQLKADDVIVTLGAGDIHQQIHGIDFEKRSNFAKPRAAFL